MGIDGWGILCESASREIPDVDVRVDREGPSGLSAPFRPAPGNRVYLGSYRYYFGPLDLYVEGTGGQFLDQDRGFLVEVKRFFGDTAFSVFYKNSWTAERANVNSEHVQMGGFMISFPLTPRRDMKPLASVQVRGADEWSYTQQVKIVGPGAANDVNTSIGLDPQPAYNLERVFYNRDRLSEEYIRGHLLRLREANNRYRQYPYGPIQNFRRPKSGYPRLNIPFIFRIL